MYRVLKLLDELRRLKAELKAGNACQAVIDRAFEIEMTLDNIYYTEF